MISLAGTYECKIDDKGRLKMPSPLMKQLSGFTGDIFVVKSSIHRPCVEIYPKKGWDDLMTKLDFLDVTFNPKHADFLRLFNKGVKMTELDTSERLLIAKDNLAYGGLKKEVVVTGMKGFLEVWDKEKYEEMTKVTEVDFAQLTAEVMATKPQNNVS